MTGNENMLKKISKSDFERLCENSQILEKDAYGPKVWLLPEGRILKSFRRKHLISSQIWMPYAARFARNAYLLKKRGIPTVDIESTFQIPEVERQAVLYKLLEGETLRDWLAGQNEGNILPMFEKFGHFVAELHQKGILFRSLHLNNVLVMDDENLGLIDISDMGFRWWGPLFVNQRIRNFNHMDRYDADRAMLAGEGGQRFIDAYLESSRLKASSAEKLRAEFKAIFSKYSDLPT